MWSFENPAIRNGVLAGIGASVYILLLYLVNAKMIFGAAAFVTTVIFIFLMVRSVKAEKQVSDHTSFSDALKPAFLTYVIANLIYIVFYYVLVNFIAPELMEMQKTMAMEMLEKMSGFLGEDAMEAAIEQMEARDFDFGIKTALWTFSWGLIFPGFIIAAIIAAVMKDRRPVAS
jgi:uncharacterized membrane protein